MIFGIGTDITSKQRFIHLVDNERFLKRLLTLDEYSRYKDFENFETFENIQQTTFLAKRWASKEAVSKALGTGIGKECSFQDIECSNDSFGKPMIKLSDSLLCNGTLKVHISYTDEQDTVVAFVVIEKV